jgi:NTP pyrophosphatase (non-canonical NTP hydrolase)
MIDNHKITALLRRFSQDRDWEQFHTPKNLATSIVVEAAELLELFQWSRGQSGWDEIADPKLKARAEEELADVLIYILRFADLAKIDLQEAVIRKIQQNGEKYPADKSRGSDKKYTEY